MGSSGGFVNPHQEQRRVLMDHHPFMINPVCCVCFDVENLKKKKARVIVGGVIGCCDWLCLLVYWLAGLCLCYGCTSHSHSFYYSATATSMTGGHRAHGVGCFRGDAHAAVSDGGAAVSHLLRQRG